jgi:hypothetical protein
VEGPRLVAVVGDGVVLRCAAVPDREVALLPTPATLELGRILMLVAECEYGVGFARRKTVDGIIEKLEATPAGSS